MVKKPTYEELEKRIQELEKAESELILAEDRLKKIFNNTHDAIFVHDQEGKILDVNDKMCRMYKLTKEEALKVNIEDVSSSKMSREILLEKWQKVLNGENLLFEWEALRPKDKSIFNVEVSIQKISFPDRDIVLANVRDITEHKRAEDALRRSEERFRELAESLPETIFELDLTGNITFINRKALEHFRYTQHDFEQGLNAFDMIVPGDRPRAMENITKIFDGVDIGLTEYKALRKDGSTFPAFFHSSVIMHEGKPAGVRGFIIDISEKKQLENQLFQAQKMESVGRLAGGVAHDFNNMLGVISGRAELGLKKTAPTDPVYKDLEQILNAAGRSANITRQLLAFARKQNIAPKVIDLNYTLGNMIKMLARLLGEDIDLLWQPADDLWPVKIDPSQLDQILLNLCVNARDAISGVGRLTIKTGIKTFDEEYCNKNFGFNRGDFVLLTISDNGCGMDKATLENLFEPFFTTKGMGKGTGLGLATVYGIVEQNNGFIIVDSEPGQGSTFNIYLPRIFVDESTDKAMPEKKEATGGTETILLVEDEASILRMTRIMLKSKGYTVLSATTPTKAIEKAKNHLESIDLLMTDVVMPEMNGMDLAAKMKMLRPDIRLLFMSGYTADVIAHQGVLDDELAFIQKPFSMVDMTMKVREVLDSASDEN